MKWGTIKLNSVVWYKYQKYIVVSTQDYPNITLRREHDNVDIYVTYNEIMIDDSYKTHKNFVIDGKKEEKKIELILDTLTEDEQRKVSERREIIWPLIVLERTKSGDIRYETEFVEQYSCYLEGNETVESLKKERLIEFISKEKGLSKRQIKRYFYNYRNAERQGNGWGEEGLIPSPKQLRCHRKDEKPLEIHHPRFPDMILDTLYIRLDDAYIPILQDVIEKEYLNLKRISDKAAYRFAIGCCKLKGIPPISYTTLHHILKSIDIKVITEMREGKAAAAKYNNVQSGFTNEEAMYPLHIVAIDHKLLDVIVIDDKTGQPLGRPWLTVGIDLYSREVWCIYLSFEKLSSRRVIKALAHGVLFKDTKGMTKNAWGICGNPTIIQFDNGKDFRSIDVRKAINMVLGSRIRFRPPHTPRYGGAVERFFRTLDTKLIHTLRGTTKGNTSEKGEYDSEKDAILTLENLKEILIQYIVDIYHLEVNRELPLDSNIPALRYYEGLKISGYPEIPEDEEKFLIELLFEDMVPYTKEGIRHDNVIYKSHNLNFLIRGRDTKYKIKYDTDDISKIYIQLPDSCVYEEVYAINPPADTIKGMSSYVYEMGRKWLKENGKIKKGQIPGADQLGEAWAALQDKLGKMYTRNVKIRRLATNGDLVISIGELQPKPEASSKVPLLDRLDIAIREEE